jgi:26S proteasome regulatory subunit T5
MSTLEDLDDLEREEREKKEEEKDGKKDGEAGGDKQDTEMEDAAPEKDEEDEILDEEILNMSTRDIVARRRLLENDLRIMKSEYKRLSHERATMNEKIKDNMDKIDNNRFAILLSVGMITNYADNFHTSLETSWRFSIWM